MLSQNKSTRSSASTEITAAKQINRALGTFSRSAPLGSHTTRASALRQVGLRGTWTAVLDDEGGMPVMVYPGDRPYHRVEQGARLEMYPGMRCIGGGGHG